MADRKPSPKRAGKLKIDATFDDALRAALKVKPADKPQRKPRTKKKRVPKS